MEYDGPERRAFSECPNPECRNSMNKFIENIEHNLYGTNGQSGAVGRIRDMELNLSGKVSRAWLIGTAISVVGILCVVFIPMVTGAIKTIGLVSDKTIVMQVKVDSNEENIDEYDKGHRNYVDIMDARNREVHLTLLNKIQAGDEFLLERLQTDAGKISTTLTQQLKDSEQRIKETTSMSIEIAVQRAISEMEKRNGHPERTNDTK